MPQLTVHWCRPFIHCLIRSCRLKRLNQPHQMVHVVSRQLSQTQLPRHMPLFLDVDKSDPDYSPEEIPHGPHSRVHQVSAEDVQAVCLQEVQVLFHRPAPPIFDDAAVRTSKI